MDFEKEHKQLICNWNVETSRCSNPYNFNGHDKMYILTNWIKIRYLNLLSKHLSRRESWEEFLGWSLLNINGPSKNFTSLTAGVFSQVGVCLYFYKIMFTEGSIVDEGIWTTLFKTCKNEKSFWSKKMKYPLLTWNEYLQCADIDWYIINLLILTTAFFSISIL